MTNDVLQYLKSHYGLSEKQAETLIFKYQSEIEKALLLDSFPYFPAKQIAFKEQLPHLDPCKECIKENDQDF